MAVDVALPAPHGARLRGLLLAWYRSDRRDLPWRTRRGAWPVLVSEVMLQQTQATRVTPVFERFIARFPSPRGLAASPVAEALRYWQGLGYNRRALNLHRAAAALVGRHGGAVPDDLEALMALPGVGEYTARAVLAFAFEQDAAPVDTNVARVLSRAFAGRGLTRRELQALADDLVPAGEARNWSQALMDLGARFCTARAPRCDACPLAVACAWRRSGGDDPAVQSAVRPRPQPRFAGSDRFHRGRLVDALRRGPLRSDELAAACGLDDNRRLAALTDGLVRDGLAEWLEGSLHLPG